MNDTELDGRRFGLIVAGASAVGVLLWLLVFVPA
jgi:hypothetical protein